MNNHQLPQATHVMSITRKQMEAQALRQDVEAFLSGRQQPSALAALAEQEAKAESDRKAKMALADALDSKKAKKATVTKSRKPSGPRVRTDQGSTLQVNILAALVNGPRDSRIVCQQVAASRSVHESTVQAMVKRMIDRGEIIDQKIALPTVVTRAIAKHCDAEALPDAAKNMEKQAYKDHFSSRIDFVQSLGWATIKQVSEHCGIVPSHARQFLNILVAKDILERKEQPISTGARWTYSVKGALS